MRQLTAELSDVKRYSDVISLIEQAILAGKAKPWMYEVLALTMEIEGRPRAQVERVLLSSRDLVPPDATSLLFLAAYLARFERFAQALRFCRQAAEFEPTRSEPYLEGLRFAERAKDVDGMSWAAVGVMAFAWGPRRAEQVAQAEVAAAEVRAAWQKSGNVAKLTAFEFAIREALRVDLHLRLEWSGTGDLDLAVDEPSGGTCSRETPHTVGGGIFVHDGYGPKPDNCFDEYLCPQAFPGEYKVRVRTSWGSIVGKRARLIVTRHEGTPQEDREVLPLSVGAEETTIRLLLKQGRRQQVAEVLPEPERAQKRPNVGPTVLQQLAPAMTNVQLGGGPAGGNFGGGGFGGGGAVGYQPIIQFFNSGISMSALATVSGDRRYVRITTQPVFSDITDVFTFSFVR